MQSVACSGMFRVGPNLIWTSPVCAVPGRDNDPNGGHCHRACVRQGHQLHGGVLDAAATRTPGLNIMLCVAARLYLDIKVPFCCMWLAALSVYLIDSICIYIYIYMLHTIELYTRDITWWLIDVAADGHGWWTWWTAMGRTWRRPPLSTRSLLTLDSCRYIWGNFHFVNLWAAYCMA